MGRRRHGRNINGILLLDKPLGMSSNAALQAVKRLFNARKAGHTGSLDPLATGLLPLCFGEATKISAYLLDADKTYDAEVRLGITTSTGDSEGEITAERTIENIDESLVREVLSGFLGEIEQIPPMFSALKKNGQPLYKLARQGIEVERAARRVVISKLELLGMDEDRLRVLVTCSKGTYIRTLAEDIGAALGCGAHLASLRRTASGPFSIEGAADLKSIQDLAGSEGLLEDLLLPADSALGRLPQVSLDERSATFVIQGNKVRLADRPCDGMVRMYGPMQKFLGIGEITADGCVAPRRIMCGNEETSEKKAKNP